MKSLFPAIQSLRSYRGKMKKINPEYLRVRLH
jgi:hypothetical protein